MRLEQLQQPEEVPEKQNEPDAPEAPRAKQKAAGKLAKLLALAEPERSEALERAVNSGAVFNLRTRDGATIKQRFGETVITVGEKSKPFFASHAIHLLWYHGDLLEEAAEGEES